MRPSIAQRHRRALALGAIVLVLSGLPGCAAGIGPGTSQVSNATPLSGTVMRPDLALIANSGPSLVGNVGAGLIGNTGAGLIGNVGASLAPSNYRTMAFALAQEAAAGAKVVLKDPESGAELTYATTTDAAGKFRFGPGVPDGRYFVEAQFQALGKEFRYRNLVEIRAGQEASALVCTITTLTTTKVLALTAAKRLDARAISLEALKAAIDELGSVLTPEGVPYMAEDSADRVPALDQLLQDNSAFYKAAQRVSPLLADPFRTWKVTRETAGTTPVATASSATASDGRRWSVDFAEHLVLRDKPASRSTEIVAGKARESGYRNGRAGAARFDSPAFLAIGPDGAVYVAETGPRRIRRISPQGYVTLVAGGNGTDLPEPRGLSMSGEDVLMAADSGVAYRIRPE